MPFIIDEKKMVNDNTFMYEEKLKSPTARFLDVTQTYTTYYHINEDQTTTDEGFVDVASIIGWKSPLRYNKIEDFPIYGLEQIVLQLQDTDQGIDTSYEGEATILNSTVKPLPNDFFVIPVLGQYYLFRVTDIQFDTIMSDNFYRIMFKLEYNDSVKMQELEKQVYEEYVCKLENVGTENNCIIKKSIYENIRNVNEMKDRIINFYTSMFYNDRYNVFLCPNDEGKFFYDPLQTVFINKHSLMNQENDISGLYLTDQYPDDVKREYKYNKSIYRLLETRKMELLTRFPYTYISGRGVQGSTFALYYDNNIQVFEYFTAITKHTYYFLSEDMETSIRLNIPVEGKYATLLQRFVRSENIQISEIPLDLDEELLYLNDSLEVFLYTPIIIYIIKKVIEENLKIDKKREQV